MLFFAPSTSKFRQKKSRNARSISKFIQKRAEMQKKAENAFQFENSCQKRAKMEKRKHIYLEFFRFYIPCAFFCILNLKIHIKKTKMQKKATNFFQIAKINMQKKA